MSEPMQLTVTTDAAWQEDVACRRKWVAERNPEHLAAVDQVNADHESRRKALHERFPHVVIVDGLFPMHDLATRWLYQHVSPPDGPCGDHYSEFPCCPLVLATAKQVHRSYPNKDGTKTEYTETVYDKPEDHSHEGVWQGFFLGKTGYDSGPADYCFLNEADKDKFVAALPAITWPEDT